jgi:hypothetical protein
MTSNAKNLVDFTTDVHEAKISAVLPDASLCSLGYH